MNIAMLCYAMNQNVCWRCTSKSCSTRRETRDGTVVEEFGFHCHVEKALNASATVADNSKIRRPTWKNSLAYVNVLRTIRPVARLDYLQRVCYQFAQSS